MTKCIMIINDCIYCLSVCLVVHYRVQCVSMLQANDFVSLSLLFSWDEEIDADHVRDHRSYYLTVINATLSALVHLWAGEKGLD